MREIIGCLLIVLHGVALNAQTPGYFDLTVRLKDGDNILRDKIIADLRATVIPDNVETTIASVETNYDGYVTIKISTSMANGKKIDWTIPNKHVKIEGRPGGSQAGLKVLADDQPLLVSAYSNVLLPNQMKINASVDGPLWEVTNTRGAAIVGNSNSDNAIFGYTKGSKYWSSGVNGTALSPRGTNFDVRGLVGTYRDDDGTSKPLYQTAGEIGLRSRAADFWKVWRNPNTRDDEKSSHLYILEGDAPNIQLSSNYGNPYIEVRSPQGYAKMSIESDQGGRLGIRSQNDIVLDAGDGLADNNKKQIIFHAKEHVFIGGAVVANGSSYRGKFDFTLMRLGEKNPNNLISIKTEPDASKSMKIYDKSFETIYGDGMYGFITNNKSLAIEFNAYSDMRIKNLIEKSSIKSDIDLIKKISTFNYNYIDRIAKGNSRKKGFIAQQVEQVFPEAVSRTTDFIPNVYQLANQANYNQSTRSLNLSVDSLTDIAIGDKVRIITKNHQHEVFVTAVNGTTFTVKDWPEPDTKEAFIYGKEINDFRVVDYDRIFTLNVSATQALIEKVETLEGKVQRLEAENQMLRSKRDEFEKRLGILESHILKTPVSINSQK